MNMNPETFLKSAETLKRIEAVCKRRFHDENDADECFNHVIDGLSDSDYRRLRSYKGKSSLNTYVYTLINSLVSDFKRKRYGRKRIPKVVSRLGALAEAVYRLICWEGFSLSEAYDITVIEGLYEGTQEEFLKETDPVREAPCRENPRFSSLDDPSSGSPTHMVESGASPLESLMEKLDGEGRITAVRIIREITEQLPDQDVLLLKLVYGSDLPLTRVEKVIGMKKGTARKRLKTLLTKYRERLLTEGIREP